MSPEVLIEDKGLPLVDYRRADRHYSHNRQITRRAPRQIARNSITLTVLSLPVAVLPGAYREAGEIKRQ